MTDQLVLPNILRVTTHQLVLPCIFWVTIKDHKILPTGTRFLLIEQQPDDWLLCWRNGIKPPHRVLGSLLRTNQVEGNP